MHTSHPRACFSALDYSLSPFDGARWLASTQQFHTLLLTSTHCKMSGVIIERYLGIQPSEKSADGLPLADLGHVPLRSPRMHSMQLTRLKTRPGPFPRPWNESRMKSCAFIPRAREWHGPCLQTCNAHATLAQGSRRCTPWLRLPTAAPCFCFS